MTWSCSVCEKSFSRKDNMQRHMNSKHSSPVFSPMYSARNSTEKCQQFHFMHPFTCMVAGMTVWVKSLLQQAQEIIQLPPERLVSWYSQWQPAYMELMVTICQGYSIWSRTRHLFWHQQTQLDGDWRSDGRYMRRQRTCLLEVFIIATSASFLSYGTYSMKGKAVEALVLTVITWFSSKSTR